MKVSIFERLTSRKKRLSRLKQRVLDYLSSLPKDQILEDQLKVIDFLRNNEISVFPYEFTKEYDPKDIEIFRDTQLDLFYTHLDGKKLYYKSGTSKTKAQKYFNSLLLEQDNRSPHRYLKDNFNVEQNDVIVDVGAAEGNFSLSVIEKARHIYLFEPDKNWIKALKGTFAPYSDKVTITQKFVSDSPLHECITLDEYFKENREVNFIKADVEGAEAQVIKGASTIIEHQKNLKIAICTYHRQEDADDLDVLLKELGFSNSFSNGYMLYYYGRTNIVREPYLRKAVLRAVKQ